MPGGTFTLVVVPSAFLSSLVGEIVGGNDGDIDGFDVSVDGWIVGKIVGIFDGDWEGGAVSVEGEIVGGNDVGDSVGTNKGKFEGD